MKPPRIRMEFNPVQVKRPDGYYGPLPRQVKIQPPHFRKPPRAIDPAFLSLIAFDPGGTTGWSLIRLPREIDRRDVFSYTLDVILRSAVIWEHGQIVTTGDEDGAAYQMAKMCMALPGCAIVVEDFILRAERKEKSRELLSPVRVTAKMEAHLWTHNVRVFKQDPSQGKRVTDERLKIWRCLAEDGMPDHARDADRHIVMFLRRCMGPAGVPLKQTAWPHAYGILPEGFEDEEELESV